MTDRSAPDAPGTTPRTVGAALRAAANGLAAAGRDTPRLEAEVLLRRVLGLDRTGLFLRLPEPLTPDEWRRFESLLARRAEGEPVAYLIGEREFMGLVFAVDPAVLIPRPDTEILVEWALECLRRRLREASTVLDIGTGSGAIALALAAHLGPSWPGTVVAADVSADALQVAAANRSRLGLGERVALVRGDLAGWCGGPVDLLLANLPYLRPEQIAANPDLAAEPLGALIGGDDGLDPIRGLLADLPRLLAPGGAIGLEVDPAQADEVVRLVETVLPQAAIEVLRDLAGLDRHVVARHP